MADSVLYLEYIILVSQKTSLVKYGIVRMWEPVPATITVCLILTSNLIAPSS